MHLLGIKSTRWLYGSQTYFLDSDEIEGENLQKNLEHFYLTWWRKFLWKVVYFETVEVRDFKINAIMENLFVLIETPRTTLSYQSRSNHLPSFVLFKIFCLTRNHISNLFHYYLNKLPRTQPYSVVIIQDTRSWFYIKKTNIIIMVCLRHFFYSSRKPRLNSHCSVCSACLNGLYVYCLLKYCLQEVLPLEYILAFNYSAMIRCRSLGSQLIWIKFNCLLKSNIF